MTSPNSNLNFNVNASATAAIAAFERLGRTVETLGREMEQSVRQAALANAQLERSLRQLQTQGAQTATSLRAVDDAADGSKLDRLSGFAKSAAIGLAGVGAAAVAGAGALAGFGLKSAAELEQTQVAFTSLLGSADLAKSQLAELQKFAAATPFEQQDVLGMAQQYYAFADSVGMAKTDVTGYLTAIGDVGAVTGASAENIKNAGMAIGQIGSSGKVTLENLNQISEAFPGFNAAAAIARAEGKPTAQVMDEISAGTLNAATGVQDLIKGMQSFPGAAGAMEAQSQTLAGVWSTFTDTIKMSLTDAFLPMVPAVKDTLSQLTPVIGDALAGVAPTIVHFATAIMPMLTPLINGLATVMDSVLAAIGPALAALAPVIEPLGAAFSALATAIAPILLMVAQLAAALLPPLLNMFENIFDALTPVFEALQTSLQPAFVALSQALQPLAPLVGELATTLGAALADAITAIAPFLPSLARAGVDLALAFVQMLVAIDPLIPVVVQLFGIFQQMQISVLAALVQGLAGVVNMIANEMAPSIAAFAPLLADLISKFGDRLAPLLLQIAPMVVQVAATFMTFGAQMGQVLVPVLVTFMETFMTVVGALIRGAADAFGWVPGVGPKMKDAAAKFTEFQGEATTALDQVKAAANIDVTANTASALQHIYQVQSAIQGLIGMAAGAERAAAAAKIDIGVSGAGVGGRAVGGPLTAGLTDVGEYGRERIFWDGSGAPTVIANAQARSAGAAAGAGGNVYVHVSVSGSVIAERDLVAAVAAGLDTKNRQNGRGVLFGSAAPA